MILSEDTHVVIVHAGIAGKKSRTEVLGTEIDPDTGKERKQTKTETTVENRALFDEATSLVNRLRRLTSDHCTTSPIGQLTDTDRLTKLEAEQAEIEAAIAEWNNRPDQPHMIEHDVIILPIGRVLDEKMQAKLMRSVREGLEEAKRLFEAGDVKALGQWLTNRKNMSALMPPIVGRVIDSAIEALKDGRKRVMTLVRELERDPKDVAAEVAATGLLSDVDTAIAWVEEAPKPDPVTNEIAESH